MKKCKENNCQNRVLGGGYCGYHQFRRHMRGGDKYKPKPRQKSVIPKQSKKRAKDNRTYLERVKAFWDKSVAEKTNRCIFCDEILEKFEGNHHLRGRGKYFLDEEFCSLAHFECHDDYHHKSIEWMMKQSWFEGFMSRIRARDITTYRKILAKIERNSELNLE